MPTRRSGLAVVSENNSLFAAKTVEIGGTTYTVNELDGGTYDECIEKAKTETGIDTSALLKFMTEKAISPKLTIAEINKLPFTKRGALYDAVNDVHFPAREVGKTESA